MVGSIFSFLYLTLSCANMGFDDSLSPFWSIYTASKQHVKSRLIPQLVFQALVLVLIAGFVIAVIPSQIGNFAVPKVSLATLVIIEGFKKTIRILLHLSFYNRLTTTAELALICVYVSTVWAWYALGNPITLTVLILPLVICSSISVITLLITLYRHYQQLPEDAATDHPKIGRIIANRFFNAISQAGHQLFSSNFLVPFFAIYAGLEQAAML